MRFGFSIFCDDIRAEPGGKLSFIGCYNGVIFVPPRFPYVLNKFCIHLHIYSPATQPYSSIVARCYGPGQDEPLVEEPIEPPSKEEQTALIAHLEKHPEAPLYIKAGTSLIFSPLRILAPGLLRVRASIDHAEAEIPLGSLRIETQS
jgi:hypothetical protein